VRVRSRNSLRDLTGAKGKWQVGVMMHGRWRHQLERARCSDPICHASLLCPCASTPAILALDPSIASEPDLTTRSDSRNEVCQVSGRIWRQSRQRSPGFRRNSDGHQISSSRISLSAGSSLLCF
jgi:hypothetical protein